MYTSYLQVTSYGACIESTGTPQSITSTPLLAKMYAIVPPPPMSVLPSSATWNFTLFALNNLLISATYSAFASDELYFPPEPVYLFKLIPLPKYPALFVSETEIYNGSAPASTSAESIFELQNTHLISLVY